MLYSLAIFTVSVVNFEQIARFNRKISDKRAGSTETQSAVGGANAKRASKSAGGKLASDAFPWAIWGLRHCSVSPARFPFPCCRFQLPGHITSKPSPDTFNSCHDFKQVLGLEIEFPAPLVVQLHAVSSRLGDDFQDNALLSVQLWLGLEAAQLHTSADGNRWG